MAAVIRTHCGKKNIFTALFVIALFSSATADIFAQVKYNVTGKVALEDKLNTNGPYDGVKVRFISIVNALPEDSTTTVADGSFSLSVKPGYYLIEWSKAGYVPEELGGFALSKDSTIKPLTMIPGEISYVSGNVSGTWTRSFVYYVTGNLTVPIGQSLTIKPGVRVKFYKGTGLTANGALIADAKPDSHIVFTSRESSPLPGDWNNIALNAPNNILRYFDYDWASDGIVASNATGTTIEYGRIWGTMKLTARGIYFNSGTSLTLRYNRISVAGEYGIFAQTPTGSYIIKNEVSGAYTQAAITMFNADASSIDSNVVSGRPARGIWASNSDNTSISYNTLDVLSYGIDAPSYRHDNRGGGGSALSILGNQITNYEEYGILFRGSGNSNVSYNRVISSEGGGWKRGIECEDSQSWAWNNTINYNYVYLSTQYDSDIYGICAWNSTIYADTVIFKNYYPYNSYAIYGDRSVIRKCYVEWPNMNQYRETDQNTGAIRSLGDVSQRSTVDSNTIYLSYNTNGLFVSYADVKNNKVLIKDMGWGASSNGWFMRTNGECKIENNIAENIGNGIIGDNSANNTILNNRLIVKTRGFWFRNNSSVIAKYNLIQAQSNRGVQIENQSGQEIVSNTIIGSTGDYGVYINNNCNPVVRNNIIQGFQKGIYAQNTIQNFNLKFNNFWSITGNLFEGTALPPLIGQFVDKNANGYSSDIYGNLNMNPDFVDAVALNYNIKRTSACINSGDPSLTDPDGTVSDIGAYPYFIYVLIAHTPLTSTINASGPYIVNAEVTSPLAKTVTAKLQYRTNNGQFTETDMVNASGKTFTAGIPGQPLGTKVDYYIVGMEGTNTVMSPFNAPTQFNTFYVTLVQTMSALNGSSNSDGSVKLQWTAPVLTTGKLLNYTLYKSTASGVTDVNLLTAIDTTTLIYTDAAVKEGRTYYYRIGGRIARTSDTVTTLFSNEASVISDKAGVVWARGYIFLAGVSSYDSVMVEYERTSPSPLTRDTVYTNAAGFYERIVPAGIYNINMRKFGWQPSQIPNQILTDNKQFDSLTMKQGYAVYVSGNVKGRWTNNNAYYVTATVTVPAGDTLIIEPGTQVRFLEYFSMTVNGLLIAAGDSLHHIEFTSGKPVPQKGDWGSMILNGPNNILRWVDYSFANDGINGGNASGTVIANSSITNLALEGRGIYLANSRELTLTKNVITLQNGIGIFASNSGKSNISDNTIGTASGIAGIQADNADTSTISNNTISGKSAKGIWVQYADYTTISENFMDVGSYGIDAQNGSWLSLKNNSVINFNDRGILFTNTSYTVLSGNRIISQFCNSNARGIENTRTTQNSQLLSNYIDMKCSSGAWDVYGINVNDSYIAKDTIKISMNNYYYNPKGICSNNSTIAYNKVDLTANNETYPGVAIESNGNSSKKSIIKNNIVTNSNASRGIWASYAIIDSNTIAGISNNQWSIGGGSENTITNNKIDNMYYGINSDGVSNNIITNNIVKTINKAVYLSNSNAVVKYNSIWSNSGRGIECINTSGKEISGNTIVAGGDSAVGAGDYGIFISNLSSPQVFNNTISGFQTGIRAESPVSNISYNNLWNTSTKFSGTGLPSIIGEVTTVNMNGTSSDVYSNIFQNPLFVDEKVKDYRLKSGSPLVNAGRTDIFDPDGTVSDIGAYYYNFGFTPQNLKVDSTGAGYVAISWVIPATDSLTGYQAYYKLSSASEWSSAGNTSSRNFVFTGLTDNQNYDFTVAAKYAVIESFKAVKISTRPGKVQLTVTPVTAAILRAPGDVTKLAVTLNNSGTKQFDISLSVDSSAGSLSQKTVTLGIGSSVTILDTIKISTSGVRSTSITLQSSDPGVPTTYVKLLIVTGSSSPLASAKFTPVAATSKIFTFVVSSGTIDGSALQTGDEVAVFSGSTCVGAAGYNGVAPFVIKAYGAEGTSAGFAEGDTLTLKAFDFGTGRYATAAGSYSAGSKILTATGFAYASLTGTIYRQYQVALAANKFNLISTFLQPQTPSASTVFGQLSGLKIVYEDNGSVYIPQYNINTIGDIDMTEGLHLFLTTPNQLMTFQGVEINAKDFTLNIEKKRFNSISYLYDKEMSITTAFAKIAPVVDIVQNDKGETWIPSLGVNTIGTLKPGIGYQIYTKADSLTRFVYPDWTLPIAKDQIPAAKDTVQHFLFTETGMPYTVVISGASISGRILNDGDEVGLFDGGVCVGATVWKSGGMNVITAWRGNEELKIPGYRAGSSIEYRLFSAKYNRECDMTPKYSNDAHKIFEGAAFSIASLNSADGVLPTEFNLAQNYPNPFNPSTTIAYDVPLDANVTIKIYNVLGSEVAVLVNNQPHGVGRYKAEWNGRSSFGNAVASGVYIIRMKANDFTSIKKALLVK